MTKEGAHSIKLGENYFETIADGSEVSRQRIHFNESPFPSLDIEGE